MSRSGGSRGAATPPPSDPKGTDLNRYALAASALLTALAAAPAAAHHPLGGLPMETFAHGLLSGIGHPVLGFDHLFFVIAMGVAAAFTARRLLTPAAYVAAMLAGCALMASGIGLPAKEAVIAASLLVVGAAVLSGRAMGLVPALVLFAGFGLFHGSAFGEAMAAQESAAAAVLTGYLIGLGVIQYAIALAAGLAVRGLLGATGAASPNARLVGAMVAGVGAFLCLEIVEGPLVAGLAG